MKLNKSKNKGKVHPSPSSSSSSFSPHSTTNSNNPVSNLNNLLPTAILTLISILSLQDKEVLAYMITHAQTSSNNSSSSSSNNNNNKKVTFTNNNNGKRKTTKTHKIPSFDCGCFDCYTSYWFRWDSSPNQELIHQAIDAFEEHLSNSEQSHKVTPNKSSRKNKFKKFDQTSSLFTPDILKEVKVIDSPEILDVGSPENVEKEESPVKVDDVEVDENKKIVQQQQQQQQQQHKGFARKVLPDVIGLLNSRLWNLWGPNV